MSSRFNSASRWCELKIRQRDGKRNTLTKIFFEFIIAAYRWQR
nr:MAG TPA: hypothetical protein [Caudoviricetes sp.]